MLVVHSRAVNGRVTLFNLYCIKTHGIIIIILNIDLLFQSPSTVWSILTLGIISVTVLTFHA